MTGVDNSEKETKFVSLGAYKLVSGRHIKNGDKNKILMQGFSRKEQLVLVIRLN